MGAQAEGHAAAVATWWPPVAHALRALGLLYGALDAKTFGGLAQDTVAAATASVQAASRAVAKRAPVPQAPPPHQLTCSRGPEHILCCILEHAANVVSSTSLAIVQQCFALG